MENKTERIVAYRVGQNKHLPHAITEDVVCEPTELSLIDFLHESSVFHGQPISMLSMFTENKHHQYWGLQK